MLPQQQTLMDRAGPHSEAVRHLFGLSARLANEKRRLESDQNLSPIGRREKEAEFAKPLIRNFTELSRAARLAKADIAAKRANFKLPEFDRTDVVGESKRQELRTFLRNLPSGERVAALDTLGDDGVLAVLDAPPALSGLPPDRHEFIKTRYLESKFGKEMRDLDAIDEDNTALEAAATMVRKDLKAATGLGDLDFEALLKSHE